MYLTCQVNYWDDDDESPKRIERKRVIFCTAVNYTEAEAIATRWALNETNEEFVISPIKELDVSEVVGEGMYFFRVDSKYYEINEFGKRKMYKYNILFIDNTNEVDEVSKKVMKHLSKLFIDFEVVKMTLLNIECEVDNESQLPE